ncbi:hypothetical protein J6590_042009, partial [Homalodisca vitripennis]
MYSLPVMYGGISKCPNTNRVVGRGVVRRRVYPSRTVSARPPHHMSDRVTALAKFFSPLNDNRQSIITSWLPEEEEIEGVVGTENVSDSDTGMLQVREVREKKQDWKSGKSQGIQSQVREFRRWSGKNIKSLYTNKLTAAAPSPSLQTTRRMKQAFLLFYICHPVSLNTAFFHPLIAKNPGDCVEKSQGKMKNLVWKSGKSQGISLLDSCSNPVILKATIVKLTQTLNNLTRDLINVQIFLLLQSY